VRNDVAGAGLRLTIWAGWVNLDHLAAQPGSSSIAAVSSLTLLTAGGVLIYAGTKK